MTATTTTGATNTGSDLQNSQKDYTKYLENLGLVAILGLVIFGLGTVAINLCLIAWEMLK